MDGAAIAAIEPQRTLITRADPLVAPQAARAPEPAPVTTYEPEPVMAQIAAPEPAPVAAFDFDMDDELPLAPPAPIEPRIVVAAEAAAPAEEPALDADGPLFPEPRFGEEREKKGFFSMFGRQRYEGPPPLRDYRNDPTPVLQARSASSAKPVEEAEPETTDDLEIPSFLRRLAN
jgi:cell division protein FtsZ